MKKIGITGQNGFIGIHLTNTFGLHPDKYKLINFKNEYFEDDKLLEEFIKECDIVIHLAAKNRHNDPEVIYNTNINLVQKLVSALEKVNNKPHVLFASSTQESKDNAYGRSKKEGRLILEQWAIRNNAQFTGMIIPNVFGPFGHPYYNSFIATFCHKLTHNEIPQIEVDAEIGLIYINELCELICKCIDGKIESLTSLGKINFWRIDATSNYRVSEILNKLIDFSRKYFEKGIMPDISFPFDRNLFLTYLCYIDHKKFFPFKLKMNSDQRGTFVEIIKLGSGGQISFSTTHPNITRGNHYHTRKAERFTVIKGKATIEIRRINTDNKIVFELDGNEPSFVDMPIWHTHNIKNTGDVDLYTMFWINEEFDPNDPDTYFETV